MSETQFETEVDIDFEGKTGKAILKWYFTTEMRSWGVKGLNVFVPDQTIKVHLTFEDADGEEDSEDFTLELKDVETDDPSDWSTICPHDLVCYKGEWEARFE